MAVQERQDSYQALRGGHLRNSTGSAIWHAHSDTSFAFYSATVDKSLNLSEP